MDQAGPELCCPVHPHLGSLEASQPAGHGLLLSTGWNVHPEARGGELGPTFNGRSEKFVVSKPPERHVRNTLDRDL